MRPPGVEPGSQAWEACMMPLHYRRACFECFSENIAAGGRNRSRNRRGRNCCGCTAAKQKLVPLALVFRAVLRALMCSKGFWNGVRVRPRPAPAAAARRIHGSKPPAAARKSTVQSRPRPLEKFTVQSRPRPLAKSTVQSRPRPLGRRGPPSLEGGSRRIWSQVAPLRGATWS